MVGNRAAADAGEDEVKVKIGDKSQRGKKWTASSENKKELGAQCQQVTEGKPTWW